MSSKEFNITLCGYDLAIKFVSSDSDNAGTFEWDGMNKTGEIVINNKAKNAIGTLDTICHELFEGWMSMNGYIYKPTNSNNYNVLMIMDHNIMNRAIGDVIPTLFDIAKKSGLLNKYINRG